MQRFDNKLHLNRQGTERKISKGVDQSEFVELIKECQRGNRMAQRRLYEALAPKMYAVCIRYMGDRSAAEDILQDGFITLFESLRSFTGDGSFEGWARKIFVNTALMSLRRTDALKLGVELEEAKNLDSPSPGQLQQIGHKQLLEYISSLPDRYRTIFNMHVIEGYSHKEISEILGISEANSRSLLLRARQMLQDKITDN